MKASCQQDVSRQTLGNRLPLIWREDKNMPLVNLIVALIVVGVALWLINRYIPMASSIKSILNIVVVVAVAVWVLQAVGLWGSISNFRVGR
jgi:predicted membrane protein